MISGINLNLVISPVSPPLRITYIICYKFTFFVWINCQLCLIAFSVTLNFQFVLRVCAIKMDTCTLLLQTDMYNPVLQHCSPVTVGSLGMAL